MKLKLLKRNKIYHGRVFDIIVDDVEYPSGNVSVREVAEHIGGSVILPVLSDRNILLIYQHRYPFDRFVWELPAGKLNAGEDPLHCAQRELAEETGYAASRWEKLTAIYTTPGFCSEVLHLYLATGLSLLPQGRMLEEGELTMSMKVFHLDETLAMIDRGEIVDAKTICGITLGDRFLKRNGQ